jgi:hypothetical protein
MHSWLTLMTGTGRAQWPVNGPSVIMNPESGMISKVPFLRPSILARASACVCYTPTTEYRIQTRRAAMEDD